MHILIICLVVAVSALPGGRRNGGRRHVGWIVGALGGSYELLVGFLARRDWWLAFFGAKIRRAFIL